MPEKRMNFLIDTAEHAKIKTFAYSQGLTVKDYVMQLVRNDMAQHQEQKEKE